MPKWISLLDLACALARETAIGLAIPENSKLGLTLLDLKGRSLADAMCLRKVPVRGVAGPPYDYRQIERWLTTADDIDVLHNRATVVINGQRVPFDHVEVGEVEARACLAANVGPIELISEDAEVTESRSRPARDPVAKAIEALWPDGVPDKTTVPNGLLVKTVGDWLQAKNLPIVKRDSILREAGRRTDQEGKLRK